MNPQADNSHSRNLPALEELQACPQWVCWRKEQRDKKLTKVPYNPQTGRWARSNDPGTWASYSVTRHAYEHSLTTKHPYDGIGYMFNYGITGIDLDHCIAEDGTLDAWAQSYIKRFASYSEISPSGEGVHILVHGTVPNHQGRKRPIPQRLQPRHPEAAIEIYDHGRFFTVTGLHLDGTPDTIEERSDLLQAVYAEMTASREQHSSNKYERNPAGESSDDALLDKAMHAKNGAAFRALWNGDTSGYFSQSEAELALCNVLAFWTGNDAHRIDRLFRRSALFRLDKWDRPARSGETYGEGTIAHAIADRSETYSPKGKIIQFRRKQASSANEQSVQLPETDLEYALACLRDEEEGDAWLYAHLCRGKCIYDHTEGVWYEWHEHHWERDECKHSLLLVSGLLASVYLDVSAQLLEEAAQAEKHLDPDALKDTDSKTEHYQWLKAMTGELIGRAKALKRLKRAQAVLIYAQAYLPVTARAWDRHIWLLACKNGVLDLRTGELHSGRPEDYIRTAIPTEWCGIDTPAPRWEQTLNEVFEDRAPVERAELIAFLQRLAGYGITGAVHEHVFGVLFGEEGRNGKDTIQHAISYTLGEISSAVSKDVLLETGKMRSAGSATPHLCDLHGKRLAWASEPEKGARFSVGQVKELSGGGEIPARGMYERRMIRVKPTHLLILLTNHKPYADPDDKAFWERLRLITCNMRFVGEPKAPNERPKDPMLWKTLEAEASGILAWLVRGCLEWQRHGLATPDFILREGEAYRKEQDILDLFILECCELHTRATVLGSVLFEAYTSWGKVNNMHHLLNGTTFGLKISKRFKKEHTKKGACYQGIGLLNPYKMHEEQESAPLTKNSSGDGDGSRKPITTSSSNPSPTLKASSQAHGDDIKNGYGDGCEGFRQEILSMQGEAPSRELLGKTPHTRHPGCDPSPLIPPAEAAEGGDRSKTNPSPNPSPAHHLVETIDGPGYLTGNKQEQDVSFVAPERQEALRYKIGVALLSDEVERFYWPRMVHEIRPEATRADVERTREEESRDCK